jgi:hypothetical protein
MWFIICYIVGIVLFFVCNYFFITSIKIKMFSDMITSKMKTKYLVICSLIPFINILAAIILFLAGAFIRMKYSKIQDQFKNLMN